MTRPNNFDVSITKAQKSLCCANISGAGSYFNCVMGEHDHGYFIAVMNWGICCELEGIYDSDYNRERIFSKFGKVDGNVLCCALRVIEEFYDMDCK